MTMQSLISLLPTLPLIENPQDINEATRLEDDLHIYGYPARAFIFRYSEECNVDTSKFQLKKYFSDDTLFIRTYRQFFKRKKNILTIGHLQKAIKYGRLNENVLKDINLRFPIKEERKKIYFRTGNPHFSTSEKTTYTLICIAIALILAVVAYFI